MPHNHTQEERAQYREKRMEEFKNQVQELANTWQNNPADIAEYMIFQSRFYHYSARNTMLIYSQNPYAAFVGSFKHFKDMGYNVLKGEHGMGIMVYAPITYFRTKPNAPWRRVSSANDQERTMIRTGMLETREQANYKVGTVFDISQTNCPAEDYPKLLGLGYNDTQHAAIYKVASDYCNSIGMPVQEINLRSATLRGQYFPAKNEIHINTLLGDTQKLSTLLHEMAHGILRHGNTPEKSTALKEFEADAFSIMMEKQYSIPITDARKAHLASAFKEVCAEQKIAEKPLEIDKLFEPVNDAFRRHVGNLEQRLEQAGVLKSQNEYASYTVRTVCENQAVIAEGFQSLEAAVGHIKQMAESSEMALEAGSTVEGWKIMPSHTQFEISANGESSLQLEYVQGIGILQPELETTYGEQDEEFETTMS